MFYICNVYSFQNLFVRFEGVVLGSSLFGFVGLSYFNYFLFLLFYLRFYYLFLVTLFVDLEIFQYFNFLKIVLTKFFLFCVY